MATWETHVEAELRRAVILVRKDHRQRWVDMAGTIHEAAIPFREAISVRWTCGGVVYAYRPAALAHSAIGAI